MKLTLSQQQELLPRALSALGLRFGATRRQVKSAYRKNAIRTHPDKPGGDREEFEAIKMAYDFLVKCGTKRKDVPVVGFGFMGLGGDIFQGVTETIRYVRWTG